MECLGGARMLGHLSPFPHITQPHSLTGRVTTALSPHPPSNMQVRYTREAVLDADVLVRLAAVPLKNVEKLAAHTIRYTGAFSGGVFQFVLQEVKEFLTAVGLRPCGLQVRLQPGAGGADHQVQGRGRDRLGQAGGELPHFS